MPPLFESLVLRNMNLMATLDLSRNRVTAPAVESIRRLPRLRTARGGLK
jgi:hypothetical protein